MRWRCCRVRGETVGFVGAPVRRCRRWSRSAENVGNGKEPKRNVLSVPGGAVVSTVAAGRALNSHNVSARSLGCCGSHGKRQPPVLCQRQGCLQRDGSSTRHMATHVFVIFAIVRVASQKLQSKAWALRTIQISGRLLRPPAFIIRHAITPTSRGLK